jgi:hypothetical protein
MDGICHVGLTLGLLLCRAGQTEQGLQLLTQSRDGFRKMGWSAEAQQAQELIDHFSV